MYKKNKIDRTSIKINASVEGEPLETKIERMVNNKESIEQGAQLIYMERNEGVIAGYNIRTDRWDAAIDAMDKATGAKIATREKKGKIVELNPENSIGKAESTGGTNE